MTNAYRAVAAGLVIWIVQMFVGLNAFYEGEPRPWWMRALQVLGGALVLLGLALAARRVVSRRTRGQA
ncbi:MAG TPA: hypothetical protein VJT84_02210 [Gaiellaceae bacterium]|nr:hypothetical protein [Gaiellaceae bacterium]